MMSVAAQLCFHCGEKIPPQVSLMARLRESNEWHERPVCCMGCRAVAELICGAGLDDYYRFRQKPGQRPQGVQSDTDRNPYRIYDQPDLNSQLTHVEADGTRTAHLILDGVTCAACGWLINRILKQQAGICDVNVNVATARVQVRWQPSELTFSQVLQSIAQLGYRPHPLTAEAVIDVARKERHGALKRLAVAGFGMMQVMMFAVAMYAANETDMDESIRNYLRIVSALCATPVMFYAGWPILSGAWHALRVRTITMDVPVGLGITLAFIASLWNTVTQQGDIYFDSVVMFVFFLNTARFVEMLARHRTGNLTDALARLVPPTAHRVQQGSVVDVATTQIEVGDTLLIRVGETIPADARIISGNSVIDESMMTGESTGVLRQEGDLLAAGTLNLDAPLTVKVTAIGNATVLSSIVRLMQRASADKAPITSMADRVAAAFLGRVLLGTLVIAAIWYVIDPTRVLPITLSVLVATCPCALSLALPTVLATATAALARRGVLVVNAGALETLAKVTQVVFDKTGTLTHGRVAVGAKLLRDSNVSIEKCRAIAAALEAHSEHPIAHAFRDIPSMNTIHVANNVRVTPGAGIEGWIDGKRYRIGQEAFIGIKADEENSVVLADEEGPLAVFHLGDRLREEAPHVVAELHAMRLSTCILSGDAQEPVMQVAKQCAINQFQWRQTPANKLSLVQSMRERDEVVLMIGDGINDAPVLQGASVSIATARASALAQVSADVVLVGDSLNALPKVLRVAQQARFIVRQNLAWATIYNIAALTLAGFGLLPPWLAAVGMSLSSMLVVLNAWRLAPRAISVAKLPSQELQVCPSSSI